MKYLTIGVLNISSLLHSSKTFNRSIDDWDPIIDGKGKGTDLITKDL